MAAIVEIWRRRDVTSPMPESVANNTRVQGTWSEAKLKDALETILHQADIDLDLFIMVDALDEHEGDTKAMARFLFQTFGTAHSNKVANKLGMSHVWTSNGRFESCPTKDTASRRTGGDIVPCTSEHHVRVKLLVASRDEANIRQTFGQCPKNQILDIHNYTAEDITLYIREKLGSHETMQSFLEPSEQELRRDPHLHVVRRDAHNLIARIVDSAEGVWLWVALVVASLLNELDKQTTVQGLHGIFDHMPQDLHSFYGAIVSKISEENRLGAFILLEVVLRADGPWTMEELTHIETHASQKILNKGEYVEFERHDNTNSRTNAIRCWKNCQSGASLMETRIRTICGGLIQVKSPQGQSNRDRLFLDTSDITIPGDADVNATGMDKPTADELTPSPSNPRPTECPRSPANPLAGPGKARRRTPEHEACKSTVQLLHGTVKDYLLHHETMKTILSTAHEEVRHLYKKHDGHTLVLDALLCHIRLGTLSLHVNRQNQRVWNLGLGCAIIFQVKNCTFADKSSVFETLDAIDGCLIQQISPDWPRYLLGEEAFRWPYPLEFITREHNLDILAFAAATAMLDYLRFRLKKDPGTFTRRKGAPLLLFCAATFADWEGSQAVATRNFLLEHQRPTDERPSAPDDVTAALWDYIDVSLFCACDRLAWLLENGADVQSRSFRKEPLIHQLSLEELFFTRYAIETLAEHGAALDTVDSKGRNLVEALHDYCHARLCVRQDSDVHHGDHSALAHSKARQDDSSTDSSRYRNSAVSFFAYLFKKRLRVTRYMCQTDFFKESPVYLNERLRQPENYTKEALEFLAKDGDEWAQAALHANDRVGEIAEEDTKAGAERPPEEIKEDGQQYATDD